MYFSAPLGAGGSQETWLNSVEAGPWALHSLDAQYMFNNESQSHPRMDSAASGGTSALSWRKEARRLQRKALPWGLESGTL